MALRAHGFADPLAFLKDCVEIYTGEGIMHSFTQQILLCICSVPSTGERVLKMSLPSKCVFHSRGDLEEQAPASL